LAQAYEERSKGRPALSAWYRYIYANARAVDADVAQDHIARLLEARIERPLHGARVSGAVEIVGTATRADFQYYKVEYRAAESPDEWHVIGELVYQPVEHAPLVVWPTSELQPGEYVLRLIVVDVSGNYGPYDEITIRVVSTS
jgi:hypothetical protein